MTARPAGLARLAGGLALATVGLQIAYPPASPRSRRALSVVTVVTFASASAADAGRVGGARAAGALLACGAGIGGLAEIVGVHTGWPFGAYRYGGTLGPQPFGVPVVVPLAWTMAAWPAWRVAALLPLAPGHGAPDRGARVLRWLGAGWALASWDLFLDPQMVAAHHWQWLRPTPSLPGVAGIPVSNFVGWLGVSLVVTGALELVLGGRLGIPPAAADPAAPGPGRVVGVLAGWTWIGGIVANAAFFRRPGVAAVGGVAMGLVAVPTLRRAWTRRGRR